MPPVVIDVRNAEDPRDVVHRAVQALSEGKIVAFPTETVYGFGVRALDPNAVERLLEVKGRAEGNPLALAIRGSEELLDYAPNASPLGERLARRCWPGPVTLVVDGSHPESILTRLPASVRQVVTPQNTVGLRVPGHAVVLDVLRMIAGPVALTSANRSGESDATTVEEILDGLGDQIDLILDDGPCRYGQPSSVIRVDGNHYEILREGAVPEPTLRRLAGMMVLFVCTGNTCRSPMAEGLFRSMAAKRLGCAPEALEEHGWTVMSAGVAAMTGGRASEAAASVMSQMGIDIHSHAAQPVTEALIRYADHVFTMTASHRQALVMQWPEAADRTTTLCLDGSDVSDPIGGPVEQYQRCAEQIQVALADRLDRLGL
jgi:protein-tyrosine phosphatase